ncbi:MAG: M20/M25/M40 family metallo-hydrolase [Gemmatimonadota bacterium]|jgi:Zn-dependent M28 family amino/carboxypeptidase
MRRTLKALALAGALLPLGFAPQASNPGLASITERALRAHVAFLASDELAGRAPGSRGGRIAAHYIASEFIRAGLRPALADSTYFQPVPLQGVRTDSFNLVFETREHRDEARYLQDAVVWAGNGQPHLRLATELVFVGYGIQAPEYNWDDYKDRDVKGKVVLILVGDPPTPPDRPNLFQGHALTYYGRWTYKLEEAARKGAAGALLIHTELGAGYGWDVVQSSWSGERFFPAGTSQSRLALEGWISYGFAQQILSSAGLSLDELYVRAARRDFRPASTGLTVRASLDSRLRHFNTANVIAWLPGHGTHAGEAVVVTAHYDHLGIGMPVDGDSIYNGAYDNASGVSVLLELARALARSDPQPDRSVLFIATAAEEAGLLGARYYVQHPVVPLDSTVADFNIDGASLWGETHDMVALGAERSTLGAVVHDRGAQQGIQVLPDRATDKGYFFRSDMFPFALAGVPAIQVEHGSAFRNAGTAGDRLADIARLHYHKPSDEYRPGLSFAGAAQLARFLFLTTLDVANAAAPPHWLAGGQPAGASFR